MSLLYLVPLGDPLIADVLHDVGHGQSDVHERFPGDVLRGMFLFVFRVEDDYRGAEARGRCTGGARLRFEPYRRFETDAPFDEYGARGNRIWPPRFGGCRFDQPDRTRAFLPFFFRP